MRLLQGKLTIVYVIFVAKFFSLCPSSKTSKSQEFFNFSAYARKVSYYIIIHLYYPLAKFSICFWQFSLFPIATTGYNRILPSHLNISLSQFLTNERGETIITLFINGIFESNGSKFVLRYPI